MPADFQSLMNHATRLTQQGNLQAATAAIQSALAGADRTADAASLRAKSRATNLIALNAPERYETAKSDVPSAGIERFIAGSHSNSDQYRGNYKLYTPPGAGVRPLPLVVMLHGCTQNPDDFAAGTAMNTLARSQGFYVLYPEQSSSANPQRCWNWFKHTHQQRGRGEPELIAEMARELMRTHLIDSQRVYVAGLSAGGAMAAILGDAYPEIFAAVGVHSGLATGIAKDLGSALSAMKGVGLSMPSSASGVATIVFHGDADATVHPSNGNQVIAACTGVAASVVVNQLKTTGIRTTTRSEYRAADGRVVAEHWLVQGASHAWSGGSVNGSYTDARGPDASAEMLRFFLQHPRA